MEIRTTYYPQKHYTTDLSKTLKKKNYEAERSYLKVPVVRSTGRARSGTQD